MGDHFCANIMTFLPIYNYEFGGTAGIVNLVGGVFYISMSFMILFWIRKQEQLASIGDHEAVKSVIFPIFVTVMWLNFAVMFLVGLVLMTIQDPAFKEHPSQSSSASYALAWGFQHSVIEGVAFLLMQKGLGNFAAVRARKMAAVWGLFTAYAKYSSYYFYDHWSVFFRFLWEILLVGFYLTLWKCPQKHLFRRPACIPYAKFWFLFRLLNMGTSILMFFGATEAVGLCTYVFGPFLFFGWLEPYVVYNTLLNDSRWWQGLAEIYCLPAAEKDHPEGERESITNEPVSSIISPLVGLNVNLHSAQSLADTLDQMKGNQGVKLLNFAYIRLFSGRLLGQGSFSKVYRGSYKQEQCAIKLIYTVDLTIDVISRVAAEAQILSSINHVNVVHIYGVAVLPPSVCIVLELCRYGSLSDVIRGDRTRHTADGAGRGVLGVSTSDKMFLALGCARGLNAVHQLGPHVCHRDIKSFNFLVDYNLQAKIADLELGQKTRLTIDGDSRDDNNRYNPSHVAADGGCGCCWRAKEEHPSMSGSLSSQRLTASDRPSKHSPTALFESCLPNWAAPEVTISTTRGTQYTQASDVFSFALVLYEILSGKVPFQDISSNDAIRTTVISGERPNIDMFETSHPRVVNLIRAGWDPIPANRPTMKEMCNELEKSWLDSCHSLIPPTVETSLTGNMGLWVSTSNAILSNQEPVDRKGYFTTANSARLSLRQSMKQSMSSYFGTSPIGSASSDVPIPHANASAAIRIASSPSPDILPATLNDSNMNHSRAAPVRVDSPEGGIPVDINHTEQDIPAAILQSFRRDKCWSQLDGQGDCLAIVTAQYPHTILRTTPKFEDKFAWTSATLLSCHQSLTCLLAPRKTNVVSSASRAMKRFTNGQDDRWAFLADISGGSSSNKLCGHAVVRLKRRDLSEGEFSCNAFPIQASCNGPHTYGVDGGNSQPASELDEAVNNEAPSVAVLCLLFSDLSPPEENLPSSKKSLFTAIAQYSHSGSSGRSRSNNESDATPPTSPSSSQPHSGDRGPSLEKPKASFSDLFSLKSFRWSSLAGKKVFSGDSALNKQGLNNHQGDLIRRNSSDTQNFTSSNVDMGHSPSFRNSTMMTHMMSKKHHSSGSTVGGSSIRDTANSRSTTGSGSESHEKRSSGGSSPWQTSPSFAGGADSDDDDVLAMV